MAPTARDLSVFVKILGFSPMETLVAATKHGGEIMGRPGELGVVTAGALADLLLVDGDPLADIGVLRGSRRAAHDHEGWRPGQGAPRLTVGCSPRSAWTLLANGFAAMIP